MAIEIHQATVSEASAVSAVLCEAAAWLEQRKIPLWSQAQLQVAAIQADVAAGLYFIAVNEERYPVGAFKYQPEDPLIWPDAEPGEAAYLHRVVVRRAQAGGPLAAALLAWAADRAALEGRRFLRLDCESSRPKLRAVYERFGFAHHSDRQVGPYHVARYQLSLAPKA